MWEKERQILVKGETCLGRIVAGLIERSAAFRVEPQPDDCWAITTKDEGHIDAIDNAMEFAAGELMACNAIKGVDPNADQVDLPLGLPFGVMAYNGPPNLYTELATGNFNSGVKFRIGMHAGGHCFYFFIDDPSVKRLTFYTMTEDILGSALRAMESLIDVMPEPASDESQ